MPKAETLKVAEKDLSSVSHTELLKIVINQKKAELDNLHHKILLAKNNLRAVEDGCRKTQSDFNQRMAVEKQEIERLKGKKISEFNQQEEKMQQGMRRLNEREMRLQERENTQVKLDTERKVVYQQRLELEKTNNNAREELKRTLAFQSEATNKINQASLKEEQANKKLAEAKQLNSSAEYQLGLVTEKEKKVKADLENIQKIREETTPKIAELKALEKKNTSSLTKIEVKETEINAKTEENSRIMTDIKKQYETLKGKQLEIVAREEEVAKQEIIITKMKKG